MMSWLDKFFSVFLGEEKKEERPVKQEEERFESHPNENDDERVYKKIENTKVHYEYPKGNFRFPLVPDETGKDGNQKRERRAHVKQGSQQKSKPARTYQPRQKEQDETSKKPFKPEAIPSPIYGYNHELRPKMKEQTEEVKQSYSSSSRNEEAIQRVTLLSEEAERERSIRQQMNIPSIQMEKRIADEQAASIVQEVKEKKMERIMQVPLEQDEPTFDIHPVSDVNEQIEDEEVHEQALAHIEQESSKDLLENEVNEPADLLDDVENESEKDQLAEAPTICEPIEEEVILEIVDQVTEGSAEASDMIETVEENFIDQALIEDEIVTEQKTVLEANCDLEKEASLQHVQSEQTQTETVLQEMPEPVQPKAQQKTNEAEQTEKRKKSEATSSVPFNVMMLKSDLRIQKQDKAVEHHGYVFPSLALLDVPPAQREEDGAWVDERKELLNATLKNFNVRANVVHVTQGPSVTRFEVHPEPGVKVNKITNLSDDIKLSLSAKDIRIEAPIPGKNTIGIEVPNLHSKMVFLREMMRSSEFRESPSPLTAALGLDISGKPVVVDLQKMPHGLIAGATGSGKSVCINTILVSLLFKSSPDEVKMLLIDPKMVELAPYNKIPHLVSPVITDAKTATAALKWVVDEMERRYELFAHSGVREIGRFNELVKEKQMGEKLPYLVVVIDELADLMMVAPNEVEESICRIAQKARACGIHLLIATQRPSVDVITGLIKANIPTRIAFSVSSQVDSRTIIDMGGAEKLLGKGDMLFVENGSGKPTRLQGNFVSDREIDKVVAHVRKQREPIFLFEQEELILQGSAITDEDELFVDACHFAIEQNSASTSSLQRRFRIGYNRAARLIDMMEREGMISGAKGSKPREVLITLSDLEQMI
ncbi:DNA translocase FtsK [Bacillus sp. NPDC077027]|uniref:DNA translocase FtsK n=1 Tax=Bacillus sp. NPDC077027 TaxID=3390548 RepID=UPI003D06C49F